MNTLKNISKTDFIDWVMEYTTGIEKSSISIMGWDDGTHFEGLCNENGGISDLDISLFKNKPLAKKLYSKDELINEITVFQQKPFLVSNNGKYRYDWDLHIWIGDKLIIYNTDLKEVEFYKLKFIGKLLGTGKIPNWIKKNERTTKPINNTGFGLNRKVCLFL